MRIHFWGVRGSIPAPLTSVQIQKKIAAVVQRISLQDIKSVDARESFLASLPDWLYSTVGANTSCIQITGDNGEVIILDAGSGLREFGKNSQELDNNEYHIFLSHFHWDHIQGLPFFNIAYNKKNTIHFYSPVKNLKEILLKQMETPYFPVPMTGAGGFTANMQFHIITEGIPISVGDLIINSKKMRHPGHAYAYSIVEKNKKFIYATDVELSATDFFIDIEEENFFKDANILILDAQYTMEEALEKENWGHSAFSYAIDFAILWNVEQLFLFHHEPNYDDKKLFSILQTARWYAMEYAGQKDISINLAVEGLDITI